MCYRPKECVDCGKIERNTGLILLGIMLGLIILFAVIFPAAAHDDAQWIEDQGLKNSFGTPCCGIDDCKQLAPTDLTVTPQGYRVNETGEIIPFGLVLPFSPDGRPWRCEANKQTKATRCLLVPPPGS